MIMEYKGASNNISLSVSPCFVEELCHRHDLSEHDPTTSLDNEKLHDQEASEHIALEADQQELYRQTVGDLVSAWRLPGQPARYFRVFFVATKFHKKSVNQV